MRNRLAALVILVSLWLAGPAVGQNSVRSITGFSGIGTPPLQPSPAGTSFGGGWSSYPRPSFPAPPSRPLSSRPSGSGAARGVFVPQYPPRAPYTVPYGPSVTRPPGSPVVPFGSSRYYYKW